MPTLRDVREDEREKHKPTRSIRMGDRWDRLGEVYGDRSRSQLLEAVAAWLLREPGARLPKRADTE